ncbi:MAG: hypothetical protein ACKOE2_03375, partial [Actinomycetales bacterium]
VGMRVIDGVGASAVGCGEVAVGVGVLLVDVVDVRVGAGLAVSAVLGVEVGVAGTDGALGASPLTPGTEMAEVGRPPAVSLAVWQAARTPLAMTIASRALARR